MVDCYMKWVHKKTKIRRPVVCCVYKWMTRTLALDALGHFLVGFRAAAQIQATTGIHFHTRTTAVLERKPVTSSRIFIPFIHPVERSDTNLNDAIAQIMNKPSAM